MKIWIIVFSFSFLYSGVWAESSNKNPNENETVFSIDIEDEELVPLNQSIVSTIRNFEKNAKGGVDECEGFKGRRINLDVTGNGDYWMAITSDGSGWYNNGYRVWILKHIKDSYEVLLLIEDAYHFNILKQTSRGLRNIIVSGSTLNDYYEQGYKYNGKKYVTMNRRYVYFWEPGECDGIKNKDVCPDQETVQRMIRENK